MGEEERLNRIRDELGLLLDELRSIVCRCLDYLGAREPRATVGIEQPIREAVDLAIGPACSGDGR